MTLTKKKKSKFIRQLVAKLRSKNQNLENQIKFLRTIEIDENNYWIEFHRKFALSLTLIILFFMGASLGSIIRKGGLELQSLLPALFYCLLFDHNYR